MRHRAWQSSCQNSTLGTIWGLQGSVPTCIVQQCIHALDERLLLSDRLHNILHSCRQLVVWDSSVQGPDQRVLGMGALEACFDFLQACRMSGAGVS